MTRPIHRLLRHVLISVSALGTIAGLGGGCLDRPVTPATPQTTARVQDVVTQTAVDKIDLLFMIDNSASMADKQQVLADAVPDLVNRLITPICVDVMEQPVANQPGAGAMCPGNSHREFDAITDIHIGIISSSLGSHGADTCGEAGRDNNDKGHLLSRGPNGTVSTYKGNSGFLAWDPNGNKNVPPGENNAGNLIKNFTDMVIGTGQIGCGFEAQLESWYRFLIEPDPPLSVSATIPGSATLSGRDDALLAQRAAFLRPDSLVALIALTDENDCSVMEGHQFYLSLVSTDSGRHYIQRGTKICETNPNDACCFNCGQAAPAGCNDPKGDPNCQAAVASFTDEQDPLALRCFDQKRKFGIDFLYPVQRYIDGLTKATIFNTAGQSVGNPLYMDLQNTGKSQRDPALVFFAGIVGVPWQDIAVDPTDLGKGYLPAKADPSVVGQQDLESANIWPIILGDPAASPPLLPSDPLMIESIGPRMGTNPRTMDKIAGLGSGPTANKINGHEWDTSQPTVQSGVAFADLQYACIFQKSTPLDCATLDQTKDSCDCFDDTAAAIQNPLCQNLTSGAYGKVQYRAKGYPGIRELQVLKGIGAQAIVASICPDDLTAASKTNASPKYGYRPAVAAIINRLKQALSGRCLPRKLEVQGDGHVPCVILEVTNPSSAGCVCNAAEGREPLPAEDQPLIKSTPDIQKAGSCVCVLNQLTGPAANDCLNLGKDPKTQSPSGWCYIDPGQGVGSCDALGKCSSTGQNVRFFGKTGNIPGAQLFITCQEKAFNPTALDGGGGTVCSAATTM